jgi:hypothetical protein
MVRARMKKVCGDMSGARSWWGCRGGGRHGACAAHGLNLRGCRRVRGGPTRSTGAWRGGDLEQRAATKCGGRLAESGHELGEDVGGHGGESLPQVVNTQVLTSGGSLALRQEAYGMASADGDAGRADRARSAPASRRKGFSEQSRRQLPDKILQLNQCRDAANRSQRTSV